MSRRLVPEATQAAIVADYQKGKRILDIEQEHDVPRATLYWVLDQAGVLPARSKRGERLRGNTEQLASLYQLIQAQEHHIEQLEELLAECVPNMDASTAARATRLLEPSPEDRERG